MSKIINRQKQAQKIIDNPEDYKICIGCNSIVTRDVGICPNCQAYRFEFDEKDISELAIILGNRENKSVILKDLE